jgi:hypothetical protein
MRLVVVTPFQRNLTDRAQRYRANREAPQGPKHCVFCGATKKLMVGHLDGHESHNEPENLAWTCRPCNTYHGNALKKARMGKRTRQFNPTRSGGAQSLGEWMQAVGAIRPHQYSYRNADLAAGSTMKTSDAVAMIRATPQYKRQEFAAQLGKHKGGRAARRGFGSAFLDLQSGENGTI